MGTSVVTGLSAKDITCPQGEYPREHAGQYMEIHLLAELWSSPFRTLADARRIRDILDQVNAYGIEIREEDPVEVKVYQFHPYGVSGTVSSPMASVLIHTWPENKYAAVDIFAQGRHEAYRILERMKDFLRPKYVHVLEFQRGQLIEMEDT